MTEIKNLSKRIDDRLRLLTKDMNKLLTIVEERGQIIDTLAREKEALVAKIDDMIGDSRNADL